MEGSFTCQQMVRLRTSAKRSAIATRLQLYFRRAARSKKRRCLSDHSQLNIGDDAFGSRQ